MADATSGCWLLWSRLDAARCRRRLKIQGAVAAETQTHAASSDLEAASSRHSPLLQTSDGIDVRNVI